MCCCCWILSEPLSHIKRVLKLFSVQLSSNIKTRLFFLLTPILKRHAASLYHHWYLMCCVTIRLKIISSIWLPKRWSVWTIFTRSIIGFTFWRELSKESTNIYTYLCGKVSAVVYMYTSISAICWTARPQSDVCCNNVAQAVCRLLSRVSQILLIELNVRLSGNDCMKSFPSSILLLSRGSRGTEPETSRHDLHYRGKHYNIR